MSHIADQTTMLVEEVRRWREDPVYFVRAILGVRELWGKQIEILEAIRDHAEVCVCACHDSAKTFTAACAALWFAISFQPSKGITTAPTDRQVRQLLWSEIRRLHAHAALPLPGEVQSAHWQMLGAPDWFMTGFSTTPDAAADHATRFTGSHSPHELVIFDEAAGISKPIWDAAEGLLTSGHHRFLTIGNPTDPNGEFARAYRSMRWHAIRIDALETWALDRKDPLPLVRLCQHDPGALGPAFEQSQGPWHATHRETADLFSRADPWHFSRVPEPGFWSGDWRRSR